ncbi:BtrH N-terminal domain-containing protein [Arcobacter sp. CECT 8985]|uniref:BtrH N-terminal domain-containing protein n=1 Tax=Arcobacter sp. CECT 8985 TaxID=1935424 RepID=UPI00100A98CD|nr:BtrH N-terminal domain-containing protein [Arcobacter sp. CECT 8985]RXJ85603.1 peptidase [Arcobacter sp. CECT 8985]
MIKEFEHSQFAHCESGVISTLLTSYGLKLSEPMAFGITSSLSFVYLPIAKISNMPLIAYRQLPKNIINRISKVLDIKMVKMSFKNEKDANKELERLLDKNQLVGLQTSVFYLPYFPKDMRFHFNAHNLLVFKKEGTKYYISDPVFEHLVECEEKDLNKARFAKGIFAPKGFLYYPTNIPTNIDFAKIIKKAIIKNAKSLLTPFPYAGIKGMTKLAKKIKSLNVYNNERYIKNFLTHIVRMQEEIGTGGGGFRFLYAAFLKESIKYEIDEDILKESSELFVKSGNTLREFALLCVESSKKPQKFDASKVANKLIEASNYEKEAAKLLLKLK